jgi:hypothetical protein
VINNFPNDLHILAEGNTYQLVRGHYLKLHAGGATLSGGQTVIEMAMADYASYSDIVATAQAKCGASVLVCTHSDQYSSTRVRLPLGEELRVHNSGLLLKTPVAPVTEDVLGEHVIARIDYIRYLLKALILGRGDISIDPRALEAEAELQDFVRAGKLSPADLSDRILYFENKNIPIATAFYTSAVRNMGEEVRHALFRSGYHLRNLTERLCQINATESARDYPGAPRSGPCERQSIGTNYDIVSYEFTEMIVASFSALDYLYRFFSFVVRRPAGDPARPKKAHFPDVDPTSALKEAGGARPSDLSANAASFAVPNLTPKRFGRLRQTRNDIAHNFGTDDIRPIVYIGIPRPPKAPLQYTQYTIRDIAPDGTPTRHAWCEQFYRHDRDAQESAYEYLESCWNCVLDTLEWLAVRFRAECSVAGISVLNTPGQGFYFL